MLPQGRPHSAQLAGRVAEFRRQPRHPGRPQLRVVHNHDVVPFPVVGVVHNVGAVIDRADHAAGGYQLVHNIGSAAAAQPGLQNFVEGVLVLQAGGVIGKTGVGQQFVQPHSPRQTFPGVLRGCGEAQPAAVGGAVQAARRRVGKIVAHPLPDFPQLVVDGKMRDAEAKERLKETQVNYLPGPRQPGAPVGVPAVNRHHPRHRSEHARDFVGQRHRRQIGRRVGETRHADVAAHAFRNGAETGAVFIRPRLPEPGKTQNDQARVDLRGAQIVRPQPPPFQSAGPEPLNQRISLRRQPLQQIPPLRRRHIERNRLLVAGMNLPPQRHAPVKRPPVPQRVARAGPFHLDHLGAKIGHQRRRRAAGHDDGQVQNLQPRQRAGGRRGAVGRLGHRSGGQRGGRGFAGGWVSHYGGLDAGRRPVSSALPRTADSATSPACAGDGLQPASWSGSDGSA